MKSCSLCLLPRSDAERICAVCDNDDFDELAAAVAETDEAALIAANDFNIAYQRLELDMANGLEDAMRARWMAWLAYVFGDIRAVETWSHEAKRLDSASPEPHLLMGMVLMRAERWGEAVEELEAGLAKPNLTIEREALLGTMRAEAFANIPEW